MKCRSKKARTEQAQGENKPVARSAAIANRGVKTSGQFAELMSALMGDIAMGRIGPSHANALCNAGGKLLKIVEMQHRYAGGKIGVNGEKPQLMLT